MAEDALPFESATGFLLARLGSMATRSWQAMLQTHGLSPHEHAVLLALQSHHQVGQQALARYIAVDPRNVVPIVDSLESRGLVRRAVDPSDRRRRLIDLTPKGRRTAERLASSATGIEREFLRGLTLREQDTLNRLLRKLRAALVEAGD